MLHETFITKSLTPNRLEPLSVNFSTNKRKVEISNDD